MLSLIISMLAIVSCIFPFHQATLLQCWMVYNHAWILFSHGCRQINWNWTQIKRNSSSLGMKGKYLSMFPIELLGVKSYPAKSARNLNKDFNFRWHQSVVHVFATSGINGIFAVTLIWIVQKLLAKAPVSSRLDYCNSIFSGIAETDLTKLQHILNRLPRVDTKSPLNRSVPLLRSLHLQPVRYRAHFNICLLT